jgi:hypothetical protein
MRRAAAAVLLALIGGCGGGDPERADIPVRRGPPPDHVVPQRPVAAGPRLVEAAPEWVREFCDEVVRRSDLLCPSVVPAGFASVGLPPERPTRRGYTLTGADGWRIEARVSFHGPPLRRAQARGGALRWRRYAISGPARPAGLRAVARGMTRG